MNKKDTSTVTYQKETTTIPAVSEGQSTLDPENPVCITTIDAEKKGAISAPKVDWIDVVVDEFGDVKVDGQDFFPNDVSAGSENPLGLTLTLRRTKNAGLHFVVFARIYENSSQEDYLYDMRCNTPGLYHLGKKYGYRKKSADEEDCPLRRTFREWGLSVDKIHEATNKRLVRRTTALKLPIWNRYAYDITDAQKEQVIDERVGRETVALTNFTYVICIEEEEEQVTENETTKFHWIRGVYLSSEVEEEDLLFVAGEVSKIMQANRKRKKR